MELPMTILPFRNALLAALITAASPPDLAETAYV